MTTEYLSNLEVFLLDLRIRGIESQQLSKYTYAFRHDSLHTQAMDIRDMITLYKAFGINVMVNYIVGRMFR